MINYAVERIQNCTKNCIICDSFLSLQMMKPAVCDNKLCLFSHEQYGIGADVASEIHHYSEVVDLLISFTAAASVGDIRRFTPFPEAIEVKQTDGSNKTITHNFMEKNEPSAHKVVNFSFKYIYSFFSKETSFK